MTLCNGRDGTMKCYEPCERYYLDDVLPLIRGYCARHTRQKVGSLVASHKAYIMAYGMHANLPSGMYCCAIGEDDIATAKRLQVAISQLSVHLSYPSSIPLMTSAVIVNRHSPVALAASVLTVPRVPYYAVSTPLCQMTICYHPPSVASCHPC